MLKFITILIAIVSSIVLADEILLRGTNDAPTPTPTPTPNVHGTNDVTLFIRALYQDCDDSNDDYLATSFLQEPKKTIASNKFTRDAARNGLATVSQNNVVYFSARTVYLDNLLKDAIENGIKQVVIIAAGYDSRAYRFGKTNPDVQFFELDLPQVIKAKKEDVIALGLSTDNVEHIGADLANTPVKEVLVNNDKFVQGERTLYFVEGLIYYLPQAAVDSLYSSLGEVAAPGSVLAYDFANKCLFEHSCEDLPDWEIDTFLKILELKQEPWKSGMEPSEHKEWLADKGFDLGELISFHDAKEVLGVVTWEKSPVMSQLNFVTAVVSKPVANVLDLHGSTSFFGFKNLKNIIQTFDFTIKSSLFSESLNFDHTGFNLNKISSSSSSRSSSSSSTSGGITGFSIASLIDQFFTIVTLNEYDDKDVNKFWLDFDFIQEFYFDMLFSEVIEGGVKQVVVIGEGHNDVSRLRFLRYGFGFIKSKVKYFEFDLPKYASMDDNKIDLSSSIKDATNANPVATMREVLSQNENFLVEEPTLYVMDGLTYHLPQATIKALFRSLGEVAAPGSVLTYDFANKCLFDQSCEESKKFQSFLKAVEMDNHWNGGMEPISQKEWLANNGFELTVSNSFHEACEMLGIKPKLKNSDILLSQLNFVTAVKNEKGKNIDKEKSDESA